MFRLIAEAPAERLLPFRAGDAELSLAPVEAITQILPFAGSHEAVSDALRQAHGLRFPSPNSVESSGNLCLVWSGLDEALALGPAIEAEIPGVALICQSDAWAALQLAGRAAGVLARLCPVDLRPPAFPPGSALRTGLGHVAALLVAEPNGVLILVPRSMAAHAVEEISGAMRAVAARGRL